MSLIPQELPRISHNILHRWHAAPVNATCHAFSPRFSSQQHLRHGIFRKALLPLSLSLAPMLGSCATTQGCSSSQEEKPALPTPVPTKEEALHAYQELALHTLLSTGLRDGMPVDFVTYDETGSKQGAAHRTKIESIAYYGAVLVGIADHDIETTQMDANEASARLSGFVATIAGLPRGEGNIPYSFYRFREDNTLEQDDQEPATQGVIDNAILLSTLLAVAGSEAADGVRNDALAIISALDFTPFFDAERGLLYGDQARGYHLDLNNDESALATLLLPILSDDIPESAFLKMKDNDIAQYHFSHVAHGSYPVPKTWNGHQEQNAVPVLFLGDLGTARFLNALASCDYFLAKGFLPGPAYGPSLPPNYLVMGIPALAEDTSPYPETLSGAHYTVPLVLNALLAADRPVGDEAASRLALAFPEELGSYQQGAMLMDSQGAVLSGPIKLSIGILAASQALNLFQGMEGWLSHAVRTGLTRVAGDDAQERLDELASQVGYDDLQIPPSPDPTP